MIRINRYLYVVVGSVAFLVLTACWPAATAVAVTLPHLSSKTLLVSAPDNKTAVWVNNFYTQGQGQELMGVMNYSGTSDVYQGWQRRYSEDNGQTWSTWAAIPDPSPATPPAVHRQYEQPGWVDPGTGRMLTMVNDAVLPTGDPLEGYYRWQLQYRVSTDGGRTNAVDAQVIQQGSGSVTYTSTHPAYNVTLGTNAMFIGGVAATPIGTYQGKILVPVQITRSSAGFMDSAVLIGAWTDGGSGAADKTIQWNLSQRVALSSGNSSSSYYRGLFEPTVVEMPDHRILMICRGSNQGDTGHPGRKWYSISSDGGLTWTAATAWKYANGANFFSPSSSSELLKHSNGKYYWIGNICPSNPNGNNPRYPLVIGEVNTTSLMLDQSTLVTIDTLSTGDDSTLQLSNFSAYEDRVTHEIVLQMTRYHASSSTSTADYTGDSYTYRIAVPEPGGLALLGSMLFGATACAVILEERRKGKISRGDGTRRGA
jgi:hypothetical protein